MLKGRVSRHILLAAEKTNIEKPGNSSGPPRSQSWGKGRITPQDLARLKDCDEPRKCWWHRHSLSSKETMTKRSTLFLGTTILPRPLLPLIRRAPLGMTRPSGSTMSWVQQRETAVIRGCNCRLSLMHMVRKGSCARSSLKRNRSQQVIRSKSEPFSSSVT